MHCYSLSKKDCEKLAEQLMKNELIRSQRINVDYYHAERTPEEKKRTHTEWSLGRLKLICATVAFGMGINKPDCRYVIHHALPKSLTNYYQESGRAGRDGARAECVLFFSFADKNRIKSMLSREKEYGQKRHQRQHLKQEASKLNTIYTTTVCHYNSKLTDVILLLLLLQYTYYIARELVSLC